MQQHGFTLIEERQIPELSSRARLWKHNATGAQLLSMCNADENKVFGVSFRTPPYDSTGVAHILEHSVLCGSAKYPVKEPFVELLKGSLQTFLNAFTYPDKTCYPVASTNLADFYNLIDVYIDAAFFPRITPEIFQQEGWHYETEEDGSLTYKGVVFNEMKGVYSSPESILAERSQQSIFPDITYGLDSGGNPEHIPDLTYEAFKAFHETYYHPANGRFYFWGDDPEEKRLEILAELLEKFGPLAVQSEVPLQPFFDAPRREEVGYAAGEGDNRGMMTINWLMPETSDAELNFAMQMLDHILVGLPASPLRKALIESGLGEDLAGGGLENELRQLFFSTGLKGINPADETKVEELVFSVLSDLVDNGISKDSIEAALNSIEFDLRENNTGRFPVGLAVMTRALTTWLYDADPFSQLAFEKPLGSIKARLASGEKLFEDLIRKWLLDNPHRSTVVLVPDASEQKARAEKEKARLAGVREGLDDAGFAQVKAHAEELRRLQEEPDSAEALATIPRLTLEDLPKQNTPIPAEQGEVEGMSLLTHDIDAKGIIYVDAGFSLNSVSGSMMPLVPLLGRAMVEMGTSKYDFVELGMRIARKTGGIDADSVVLTRIAERTPDVRLFIQGKATTDKAEALFELMRDVLLDCVLDQKERFKSILLEEKARMEHRLVPSGHLVVMSRLRSHFGASGWLSEQMDGLAALEYMRELIERVDNDWQSVLADLTTLREAVVGRAGGILNLTGGEDTLAAVMPHAQAFAAALPQGQDVTAAWYTDAAPQHEAMVVPSQVNYVGKAANLYDLGYSYHGSANVIFKHLRMAWLWDKVRVQGGAYGAFCAFDRASGVLAQVSYRDPNLESTLDVYDRSADYLRHLKLTREELVTSIVGAIGEMDAHMLPHAKGMSSLARLLTGDTEERRQQMRDDILSTRPEHFTQFADILAEVARTGTICVLGGESVEEVAGRNGWVVNRVM
ncbi:insulinase family protein [Oleidesulfovibrio sp.]|uniref:insulinase family protein n=1 Tax=Oleidesulfovibrio sp. TaxID=2909707 RepID=UPI003A8B2F32